MDRKLILNDGTEISGYLLESGDRLFLYMYGRTMAWLFGILSNPEKVSVITCKGYGEQVTVRGYEHLYCISEENGGMISAGLKKN